MPAYACLASRFVYGEEFKKPGFMFVTLDLKGYRTGSMNATIKSSN